MKIIKISDKTLKSAAGQALTFREKIELCKILDKTGVTNVEIGEITNLRTDGLLIKSIASALNDAKLTVQVPTDKEGIEYVWSCLSEAKCPRLQVSLPVSAVQMEYLYHKKPDAMLSLIGECTALCCEKCSDVEFSAGDAGRADSEFLIKAVNAAVNAGAKTVTLCDTAGTMLPDEIFDFVSDIRKNLPTEISLGIDISNGLYVANACALYAIKGGADEVKVSSFGDSSVSLLKFATLLKGKGDNIGVSTGVRTTELERTAETIENIFRSRKSKSSPFENSLGENDDFTLNVHDDAESVDKAARELGYELSAEDISMVCEALAALSDRKSEVTAKELDILIATVAMQVPPTYKLDNYVINSGNKMTSTSLVSLVNGEKKVGLCTGDGPIDASFLAIEQITGTHYELDDFSIRAVTEGQEAMGEAVVRLRSNGRLYSGRGLSTDIVGSSIMAYINALNKIVYEEAEE